MSVKVLFFASLREQVGKSQAILEYSTPITALQVWQLTSGKDLMPNTVRVAINQSYSDASTGVQDGDEVAFFPPVTGG
jgi:molybdopterin synthase sulfur carrier subunit